MTATPATDAPECVFVTVVQVARLGSAMQSPRPRLEAEGVVAVGADRVSFTAEGAQIERPDRAPITVKVAP